MNRLMVFVIILSVGLAGCASPTPIQTWWSRLCGRRSLPRRQPQCRERQPRQSQRRGRSRLQSARPSLLLNQQPRQRARTLQFKRRLQPRRQWPPPSLPTHRCPPTRHCQRTRSRRQPPTRQRLRMSWRARRSICGRGQGPTIRSRDRQRQGNSTRSPAGVPMVSGLRSAVSIGKPPGSPSRL